MSPRFQSLHPAWLRGRWHSLPWHRERTSGLQKFLFIPLPTEPERLMSVPRHCDFLRRSPRQRHCSRHRLKFPHSPAWPCPPLTSGSAQGNPSLSRQHQGFGRSSWVGAAPSSQPGCASPGAAAPSGPPALPATRKCQSLSLSCLDTPSESATQSADSVPLLENVSLPAPTKASLGFHPMGKALGRARMGSSPGSEARGSLKLILAEVPAQVVARDSLSPRRAIFARQDPEITG